MKQFKIFDVIISLILIIIFAVDAIWNAVIGRSDIFSALPYWFFLIGAWHIISMLLHIVKNGKPIPLK